MYQHRTRPHLIIALLPMAVWLAAATAAVAQTPDPAAPLAPSAIDPFQPALVTVPQWIPLMDSALIANSQDSSMSAAEIDSTLGITGEPKDTAIAAVEEPVAGPDPVKLFNRSIARHWALVSKETGRAVDSLRPRYMLRLLTTAGHKPIMPAPFNAKTKPVSGAVALRCRVPAMSSRLYTCDSSVEAVAWWYARTFGFSFRFECAPLDSTHPELGSLSVARAVRRVGNSVVSVMIWNPQLSTALSAVGKGKHRKTKITSSKIEYKTNVALQERLFRSRDMLVAEGPDAMVEFTWKVPYSNLIVRAATKYQLDPHLIAALMQQESNFNKGAISVDSAMGLMQMIPGTAAAMGVTDPMNPAQAVDGGVRYLKMMFRRYKGDPYKALAAYNAGPGNVDKYHGIPPFAETKDYVKRIINRYTEKAGGVLAFRAAVYNPMAPRTKMGPPRPGSKRRA